MSQMFDINSCPNIHLYTFWTAIKHIFFYSQLFCFWYILNTVVPGTNGPSGYGTSSYEGTNSNSLALPVPVKFPLTTEHFSESILIVELNILCQGLVGRDFVGSY